MSYRCLADFLEQLAHAGEMVRVEAAVNPVLEAAEISARSVRSGGPALLFGTPSGFDIPLLTNLLASTNRICQALGVASPNEVVERIALLTEPAAPEGWFEKLKTAPHVAALSRVPPRRVKSAPCQQIVRLGGDVDLGELPALKSAPEEPGRTITAAVLFTADADTHRPVVGRWDLPVLDHNSLAIACSDDEEPARLLLDYRSRNEKMPVAIVMGGDPALLLAAMAPVPAAVETCALAGLLREKPLDVVACREVDLLVPSDAEIVIEGYVDPAEPPREVGPLATLSGSYSRPRPMSVVRVTAIAHRANPVFPAMVPGHPPHEAGVVVQTLGRMFLPLVKASLPGLVDFHLPAFGGPGRAAVLSIHKTYLGQARRAAQIAWSLPAFQRAKLLVLVDDDVDVRDNASVLSAVNNNVHPARDVMTHQGPPDPTDPTTLPGDLSHLIALDATRNLPGERTDCWPQPATMPAEIRQLVTERWGQYGLEAFE